MRTIEFNLSPSLIGSYNDNQLSFYFAKILKQKPDTRTIQIYGQSGSIVHDSLEQYVNGKTIEEIKKSFDEQWIEKNLYKTRGLNGKPLKKDLYWRSVLRGQYLLDEKYTKDNSIAEEQFIFPLIDDVFEVPNENNELEKIHYKINIKGFADLQSTLKETGERVLCDYKTSSNVDKGDGFKTQALHYIYSIYMKRKQLIKTAIFEYVKINKDKTYKFDLMDINNYHKKLQNLAMEMINKGMYIKNYSIGD